jgi:aspartyl-tRNA(Asn)/glutamyl-tRNA(Gln) amidotransferase subunit A
VPIAVKDVILTRGLRTTCASRMLETYIPPYDATAVIRIEQAGGVIIGKTNCDEFAMGSSNENSAFGPVRNPVALDRVPGGSSGGSAAVIAQGTAVLSLGSDTGGSIRQPASFCGVTGVTPTYGRVSRYGLTAFASSLDHIGPFSRTVRDSARLLQVMAGRDEMDSTSAFAPVPDYVAALDGNIKGMKIGIPKEFFDGLASDTGDVIQAAIQTLQKLGCEIRTRPTRWDATTSSVQRKRAPIWLVTMACATRAAPSPRALCKRCIARPAMKASARSASAGSCWEPTSLARATTTRII